MCDELSGLLIRPIGDKPAQFIPGRDTRHHKMLIALHGLSEGVAGENFLRWEYTPKEGDWMNCTLRIDETRTPGWLDSELRDRLEDWCQKFRDSLLLREDKAAILGGKHIVTTKVNVKYADSCIFLVGKGGDLTIDDIGNVTFGYVYTGGTVTTGYVGGTVTTCNVGGTVTTGYVGGTVTTGYVEGTVTTGYVGGTVTTGNVEGTFIHGEIKEGGIVQKGESK